MIHLRLRLTTRFCKHCANQWFWHKPFDGARPIAQFQNQRCHNCVYPHRCYIALSQLLVMLIRDSDRSSIGLTFVQSLPSKLTERCTTPNLSLTTALGSGEVNGKGPRIQSVKFVTGHRIQVLVDLGVRGPSRRECHKVVSKEKLGWWEMDQSFCIYHIFHYNLMSGCPASINISSKSIMRLFFKIHILVQFQFQSPKDPFAHFWSTTTGQRVGGPTLRARAN